jgi:hypothetical protein
MATPTSTGKSAAHVKANSSTSAPSETRPELDLPVVPDFVSIPPRYDRRITLDISDFFARKLYERSEVWKLRAKDGCDVEFDLEHPNNPPPTYPAELIDELLGAALRS